MRSNQEKKSFRCSSILICMIVSTCIFSTALASGWDILLQIEIRKIPMLSEITVNLLLRRVVELIIVAGSISPFFVSIKAWLKGYEDSIEKLRIVEKHSNRYWLVSKKHILSILTICQGIYCLEIIFISYGLKGHSLLILITLITNFVTGFFAYRALKQIKENGIEEWRGFASIDDKTANEIDPANQEESGSSIKFSIFNDICVNTPAVMDSGSNVLPLAVTELHIAMSRCIQVNSSIDRETFDGAFNKRMSGFLNRLIGDFTNSTYDLFAKTLSATEAHCRELLCKNLTNTDWSNYSESLRRYIAGYISIIIFIYKSDQTRVEFMKIHEDIEKLCSTGPKDEYEVSDIKIRLQQTKINEFILELSNSSFFTENQKSDNINHLYKILKLLWLFIDSDTITRSFIHNKVLDGLSGSMLETAGKLHPPRITASTFARFRKNFDNELKNSVHDDSMRYLFGGS